MIKGQSISLHLVNEKHLDTLYSFHADISNRGDYFHLHILPEPLYKAKFHQTGFWTEELSQLLIFNQENHLVGSIWAMKTVPYFDATEIGYIIFDKKNYGKGYISEALSLFVDYLFKVKTLNRIELRILPNHAASEKIALKCGFTFEGTIRGCMFHHGQHDDLRQFSLLRNDWKALSKKDTP